MSDWIEWNGGEMPVPKGTKITVKHRDRSIFDDLAGGDYSHDWNSQGYSWDIVAYMIHEPKGHQNASILMEIAKEAAINPEYWEEFEAPNHVGSIFLDAESEFDIFQWLLNKKDIRRKPRTIRIGNYDVPEFLGTNVSHGGFASTLCIKFDNGDKAELMLKALQELIGENK